jgi:hypothetical protein
MISLGIWVQKHTPELTDYKSTRYTLTLGGCSG